MNRTAFDCELPSDGEKMCCLSPHMKTILSPQLDACTVCDLRKTTLEAIHIIRVSSDFEKSQQDMKISNRNEEEVKRTLVGVGVVLTNYWAKF